MTIYRETRLKEEFGYIFNFKRLNKDSRIESNEKVEWRHNLWKVLAARNSFILKNEEKNIVSESMEDSVIEGKKSNDAVSSEVIYEREGKTSVQIGEELETPVLNLMEKFLSLCGEKYNIEVLKKRKQRSGFQFGYDLEFSCRIKGSKELNLRIECKNYKKN